MLARPTPPPEKRRRLLLHSPPASWKKARLHKEHGVLFVVQKNSCMMGLLLHYCRASVPLQREYINYYVCKESAFQEFQSHRARLTLCGAQNPHFLRCTSFSYALSLSLPLLGAERSQIPVFAGSFFSDSSERERVSSLWSKRRIIQRSLIFSLVLHTAC